MVMKTGTAVWMTNRNNNSEHKYEQFLKNKSFIITQLFTIIFKKHIDQQKRSFHWKEVHASKQDVHTMRRAKAQNMEETFDKLRDEQDQGSKIGTIKLK